MARTIFGKAQQGLNLTPAERSILKLVEGLLAVGIVAALPVIASALANGNSVDWANVAHVALAAGATAITMAFFKWVKAHADAPLPEPTAPPPSTPPAVPAFLPVPLDAPQGIAAAA